MCLYRARWHITICLWTYASCCPPLLFCFLLLSLQWLLLQESVCQVKNRSMLYRCFSFVLTYTASLIYKYNTNMHPVFIALCMLIKAVLSLSILYLHLLNIFKIQTFYVEPTWCQDKSNLQYVFDLPFMAFHAKVCQHITQQLSNNCWSWKHRMVLATVGYFWNFCIQP